MKLFKLMPILLLAVISLISRKDVLQKIDYSQCLNKPELQENDNCTGGGGGGL